jgi:predicted transcriptional regulator
LDGHVPDATDAIISIHPDHANAILAGTKTIELRRRIPELPPGTRLWIYATRPTGAVVGFATIQDVAKAHPATIWKRHRASTGLDYESFKAYFNGSRVAVAILLAAARRVEPITIPHLRQIRESFHPPQVLTLLTLSEARALRKLAGKHIAQSPR